MSLPQVIGLHCVICKNEIHSIRDGGFCKDCGNAVHRKCEETSPGPVAGRCHCCGGDPADVVATEVRRVRNAETQAPISRPYVEHPISNVCPKCGDAEYTRQRPQRLVAFASDRICKKCGTGYSPPTPVWAGWAFVSAGLLLMLFGCGSVVGSLVFGDRIGIVAAIFCGAIGVAGLLATLHVCAAFQSLAKFDLLGNEYAESS